MTTITENTLVISTNRTLTDTEMLQLAIELEQEAIPQRTGRSGQLYGPKAAEWGDFNPEFFKDFPEAYNVLNIGLNIGDDRKLTASRCFAAIAALGVAVIKSGIVSSTYEKE